LTTVISPPTCLTLARRSLTWPAVRP